jgi:hypothetical protein
VGGGLRILPAVAGQMYDPAVQRALLETLARWRRLPEGDLVHMLSPVERLRYRDDALQDLEWEGLVTISRGGDEPVIDITPAGDAWLAGRDGGRAETA